jgi:hypothetical protein
VSEKRQAKILAVDHNPQRWSQLATTSGRAAFMRSQFATASGPDPLLMSQSVTANLRSQIVTSNSASHGVHCSRPFTGVSGAAGIRPGIHAGLAGHAQHWSPRPVHGPSRRRRALARTADPSTRPVNEPDNRQSLVVPRSPVLKDGPNTACGGKGRKRPWICGAPRPDSALTKAETIPTCGRIGFHAKPEARK